MKKRFFSILLSMFMLLSTVQCIPTVNAEDTVAYSDVSVDSWYFQAVTFCTELGLMNGIGQGQFAPAGTVNRAMFVTILHRLAGSPDAIPSNFTDVPNGSFYAKAVNWAAEQGIVNGTSETTFSPERSIIRQDMACMLARYLIHIDADILRGYECEQYFVDVDLVSDYAQDAVELMRRTGLFRGDEASNFRPLDTANRAEAATLFTRLALEMGIIPSPAILESNGESWTLSVEDTIWLYNHLTGLDWQDGLYAEYVPTHTLTLWNGEYRFELPEGEFHNGINYVCGDSYMGNHQVNPILMQLIYERFAAYTR